MDTMIEEIPATARIPGVEYDVNGKPVGISLNEWMDKLDRKLVAHYGEDFRKMLNQARIERGMLPLS
jgi:hypothetical protein